MLKVDSNGTLSSLTSLTANLGFVLTSAVPIGTAGLLSNGYAFDPAGNLYLTDSLVNSLDRYAAGSGPFGTVQAVAGYAPNFGIGDNGAALNAGLNAPQLIGLVPDGSLLVADQGNNRVRRLSTTGNITTVAGTGSPTDLLKPFAVTGDAPGNIFISAGGILQITPSGMKSNISQGSTFGTGGVVLDSQGNILFADFQHPVVRKISPLGQLSVFAGNGQSGSSGDGGPALSAKLSNPQGLTVDPRGNVYIADFVAQRIRKVAPDGTISTFAGGGTATQDGAMANQSAILPKALASDRAGNIYASDAFRVRKIALDGTITTVAGTGAAGFSGDGGPATAATMSFVSGLAVDAASNLYISDQSNNRVRKVLATAPTISISSSQVTLSGASLGTPVQSTVTVTSSVPGLGYTVNFATVTGGAWLGLGALQGQAPSVLTITADPSNLQPGTYQGSITITSPNGSPNSLTIAVTFQVATAPKNGLVLQTQSLTFSFTAGNGPSSQQLSVANQGSAVVSFTALASTTTGGTWLTVSPLNGSVSNGAPAYVTVTATPGKLSAGTYSGSITFSSADTKESITVPVTMSISTAQQKIVLSQTGLSFTAVAQAGPPLPQNFGILNQGVGTLNWTATVSTVSGGAWLSIDLSSGTVARPLLDVSLVNVNVDPSLLAPGDYYGTIQVKAIGAANSPQSISVKLTVLPAGSNPGPQLSPTGVIFIGTQGNNPSSQNVTVSNPSPTSLPFGSSVTYVSGGGWLQYLPANSTVASANPVRLILQPNLSSLPVGIQRAAVTLVFDDGSIRAVAVLTVVAPAASSGNKPEDRAAIGCNTIVVHPTALTDTTNTVPAGQPVTMTIRVADNCGNPITNTNGAAVAAFSNGDTAVSLVHVGNGTWSGTWTPTSRTQGPVTIQYSAYPASGVNVAQGSANVPVNVVSTGSIPQAVAATNAASGAGIFVAPGGLVSIYGANMASGVGGATTTTLPTQLGDTQVLIGGTPVPLRYVSAGQVNAQIPFELQINTGQQIIVRRGNSLSVPQPILVAPAQPAIYIDAASGTSIIVNPTTNALITSAKPAKANDVVVIYCNGLGAVSPAVPSGSPAPSKEPLARTANTLTATIGNLPATVNYAGLVPGYPDLYQVNLVVPKGIAPGNAAVVLTIAGQSSPPVALAVQ
jgi:uncharacterized protein (TIGR03437 family)